LTAVSIAVLEHRVQIEEQETRAHAQLARANASGEKTAPQVNTVENDKDAGGARLTSEGRRLQAAREETDSRSITRLEVASKNGRKQAVIDGVGGPETPTSTWNNEIVKDGMGEAGVCPGASNDRQKGKEIKIQSGCLWAPVSGSLNRRSKT